MTASAPHRDNYKLFMIATLLVIPLLIVFQRTPSSNSSDDTMIG
jgi:hypothetical protein